MEQWLWAERKTPNRRKLSDSNRDVPSCVVTYLYPAKSTAGIVPCCCGFGRLHFSRWDGPPEKKSHLRSCSDRRVRVTSGFARDRPHGKRGQIFDGRGLMAGSLNYYHLSPPDLDGCRGTGGGRGVTWGRGGWPGFTAAVPEIPLFGSSHRCLSRTDHRFSRSSRRRYILGGGECRAPGCGDHTTTYRNAMHHTMLREFSRRGCAIGTSIITPCGQRGGRGNPIDRWVRESVAPRLTRFRAL